MTVDELLDILQYMPRHWLVRFVAKDIFSEADVDWDFYDAEVTFDSGEVVMTLTEKTEAIEAEHVAQLPMKLIQWDGKTLKPRRAALGTAPRLIGGES